VAESHIINNLLHLSNLILDHPKSRCRHLRATFGARIGAIIVPKESLNVRIALLPAKHFRRTERIVETIEAYKIVWRPQPFRVGTITGFLDSMRQLRDLPGFAA